jgi:hypothetical protein
MGFPAISQTTSKPSMIMPPAVLIALILALVVKVPLVGKHSSVQVAVPSRLRKNSSWSVVSAEPT